MHTVTMNYPVKDKSIKEFVDVWKKDVFEPAKKQPGLISMQLLVKDNTAMAIGCWEEKKNAEDFMATGVFKSLMDKIKPLLSGTPVPEVWTLEASEVVKKTANI